MHDNEQTEAGRRLRVRVYPLTLRRLSWLPSFVVGIMRRLIQSSRLVRDPDQRISVTNDIVTMEDLIEAHHALGYDAQRGEWALRVGKSFGVPRKDLGILLLRLRDDGEIVLRIDEL